jgi:hypothetical protein
MPISRIPAWLHTAACPESDDRPIEGVLEESEEVREFSGTQAEPPFTAFAATLPQYEVRRKSIFPEITDRGVTPLHTPVRATAQLRPLRTPAAPPALLRGT